MIRPRVATTKRHLELPGKGPFFWLADTAWELFHRLDREETLRYLDSRKGHGFNVIMAVGLAELDGVRVPNMFGDLPLVDEDPSRLNEGYWKHVDWVIEQAAERELYIGLLPTWGDKVFAHTWGAGPEILSESSGFAFGKIVATRYREVDNVIWINGGDRPSTEKPEVWRALAKGLIEGDGGKTRLMSYHPMGGKTSSEFFHEDEWLDFNMWQSGHGNHEGRPDEMIGRDLAKLPAKPVLDGEPRYENHPIFEDSSMPYFDADDIRRAIYLGVFAGACGTTYGCHAMWQFAQPEREPVNNPVGYWFDSLDLPGVSQLRHLVTLMEEIGFGTLEPAKGMVKTLSGATRALINADQSLLAVYVSPAVRPPLEVALPTGEFSASWFNPRNGEKIAIPGKFSGATKFIAPSWAKRDADWILVLVQK